MAVVEGWYLSRLGSYVSQHTVAPGGSPLGTHRGLTGDSRRLSNESPQCSLDSRLTLLTALGLRDRLGPAPLPGAEWS